MTSSFTVIGMILGYSPVVLILIIVAIDLNIRSIYIILFRKFEMRLAALGYPWY
jgi:hypothetical protein